MTLTVAETDGTARRVLRTDRVRIDGLALRVRTLGDATAPGPAGGVRRDFVMVHGLGASSATFEHLAGRLRHAGTVHLLDLPGFAHVPRPAGSLGIEDLARLVTCWAERAGVAGATFVGHSMGTQVVGEILAASPGTASHAVLVGPTVDDAAPTAPRQLLRLARSVLFESHGARAVMLRAYAECGPRWYLAELRRMLPHRLADRLAGVDVPVLVVRGEHDHVAPPAWVAHLAAVAPHGSAVTVPGAAHAAMHTHAREVADLVLEHVRR